MNENDLMSKLVASKAIMDSPKFNQKTGSVSQGLPQTTLQDFDMPQAKYNIPQEFLQESQPQQPYLSEIPRENTKPVGVPTVDAIKNSRLPDEIKKLMIEHPISQPTQPQGAVLSNELVEKAARLMKTGDTNYIPESAKPKQNKQVSSVGLDYNVIKQMITEAVNDALKDNGLLVESTEKSSDIFSFKVGKHIFEGKVTKIKKLS